MTRSVRPGIFVTSSTILPSSALNLLLVGLVAAQRFLQRLEIADDALNAPHVDLGERFEAVTPAAGKGRWR